MLPQRACPTWKKIRERYRRRRPWKKNSRALPQGGLPALETKFASVSAGEPAPLKTQSLGGPPPCKKNRERYRSGPAPLGKNSRALSQAGLPPVGKNFASATAERPAPRWKKIRERAERPAPRWKKFRERYRKGPAPLGKKFASATPFGKNLASLPFLEKFARLTARGPAPLAKKSRAVPQGA